MADLMSRQRRENWLAEFLEENETARFKPATREAAERVLAEFLAVACARDGSDPGDLDESDVKAGLLDGVTRLELGESVERQAPELCAAFMRWLQQEGRHGKGRALGAFLVVLAPAFLEKRHPRPVRRPGAKVGPNDPCPCGSGRKYKKCCGR